MFVGFEGFGFKVPSSTVEFELNWGGEVSSRKRSKSLEITRKMVEVRSNAGRILWQGVSGRGGAPKAFELRESGSLGTDRPTGRASVTFFAAINSD